LGRIVLPNSLRKDFNWESGDNIAIYALDKNTVILHMHKKGQQMLEHEKQQAALIFNETE